uniref:PD-(D/E)XK nuclease family protein n=1 Tax=uncultured Polaribacter sp. TaxID=174711 RepID=UPI0030DC2398
INYLIQNNRWNDEVLEYTFGDKKRVSEKKHKISLAEVHQKFISTPWQEHNVVLLASASKLWNTLQGEAINFGNLFHEILAKIITKNDVDKVIEQYYQQGFVDEHQAKYLKNSIDAVVEHPDLKKYYSKDVIIYNEREIVDVDNQIIIPDRLVLTNKNDLVIIDYKTGNQSKEHHQQLLRYERVLKSMNFNIHKKILIYLNDKIDVVEV